MRQPPSSQNKTTKYEKHRFLFEVYVVSIFQRPNRKSPSWESDFFLSRKIFDANILGS